MRAVLCGLLLVLVTVNANLSVDFNIPENSQKHHTDHYRAPSGAPQAVWLIIRLWDPFVIKAQDGSFNPSATYYFEDELSGDQVQLPLTVLQATPKAVTLSADFNFIGRYSLCIKEGGKTVYKSSTKIVVLFNPWNANDETYVSPEAAKHGDFRVNLTEHVLNEQGAVWKGSANSQSWIAWAYNHLELQVLNVTLNVLSVLKTKQRDAIRVSRFLTVGAQTILQGRWDNQYSDGKPPGYWSSSSQIISAFIESNRQVVKYGQCWVFASLYVTLGRTLGLPTTCVTNFDSAHEHKPFRQQCDMKYKVKNGQMEFWQAGSTCSIWNFHVWNMVWINRRDDLPGQKAGGWQAVDATPQETSVGPNEPPFNDENYYTGPASIALLHIPEYRKQFNNDFVGGEANALVVYYTCVDTKCTEYARNTSAVGNYIIGKKPDGFSKNSELGAQGYSKVDFINWSAAYKPGSADLLPPANNPLPSDRHPGLHGTTAPPAPDTHDDPPPPPSVHDPKNSNKGTTKGTTKGPITKGPTKDPITKGPTKDPITKGPTKDPITKGPTTTKGPSKDTITKGPTTTKGPTATKGSTATHKRAPFITSTPKLHIGESALAVIRPNSLANPHGTYMLAIWLNAVDYMTGDTVEGGALLKILKPKNVGQVHDDSVTLEIPKSFWSLPTTLAALSKTNHFQFIFSAVPKDKGEPFLKVVPAVVLRPQIPVLCGPHPEPNQHFNNFKQGDTMHCVVKFFNPLTVKLTGVEVVVTVSGLAAAEERNQIKAQKKVVVEKDLPANATDVDEKGHSVKGMTTMRFAGFQFQLMVNPGKQVVTVSLNSHELKDVHGSNVILVAANPHAMKKQSSIDSHTASKNGIRPSADKGDLKTPQQRQDDARTRAKIAAKVMERSKKTPRPSAALAAKKGY